MNDRIKELIKNCEDAIANKPKSKDEIIQELGTLAKGYVHKISELEDIIESLLKIIDEKELVKA